ncbi:type IV pilin protein [Candidatus Avelusimicrobium fimicolum]|uniref:type IV pilin protein n=1 Tax=Candidatus Avelusimicrobium fimicolum TaxID=3416216 RepID=UPI003D115FAE
MKGFIEVSRAATCASVVILESCSPESVVAKRRDSVTLRAAKPYGKTFVRGGRTASCTISAGFTLIELLVVVLIIGILVAVAVPQYQLAVMKSRVSALMPLLRSISDAEDAFYLANGYYTHIKNLDIALPQDYIHQYADRDFFWADGTYVTQCGKGCGGENGQTVTGGLYQIVGNTGAPKVAITFYGQYSSEYQNRRVCTSTTSLGTKVCKNLGGKPISNRRWLLP